MDYRAPNGVLLSTTGRPYCYRVNVHNSGVCSYGVSALGNLIKSHTNSYYTSHAATLVTYQFPIPLYIEYILIYPNCSSQTQHWLRMYLNGNQFAGSSDWADTSNCLQGQPGRINVKHFTEKVYWDVCWPVTAQILYPDQLFLRGEHRYNPHHYVICI